jgi:peptidoglycan/xylan/chitin deacetylase (PgdA/CDA1 family)
VDRTLAYVVALISALGHTYAASKAFPTSEYLSLFGWQFEKTASLLLFVCYLLDITRQKSQLGNPQSSLSFLEMDRVPAATHDVHSAKGQSGRSHNLRLATKLLVSSICIAIVVLLSFRHVVISDLYAVDVDLLHITQGSSPTSADDESAPEQVVMLTIDDGPRDSIADGKILDILNRHSAKAVWLVNCATFDATVNPRAAENLQTLRQIENGGHLIGNHGYSHLDLQELAVSDHAKMVWEIDQCSASIGSAIGSRPKYFRAPFGAYSAEVLRTVNHAGMAYMQWSRGYDSLFHYRHVAAGLRGPSEGEVRQLSDSVENGDIILMHDDQRTADSLDGFLANLERRGYKFVLPPSRPEISQQG